MGANTHYDYISSRGGGSSLTSCNSVSCHSELGSESLNFGSTCKVLLDKDNIPRPLWEREQLCEQSELQMRVRGLQLSMANDPSPEFLNSLRSVYNCRWQMTPHLNF